MPAIHNMAKRWINLCAALTSGNGYRIRVEHVRAQLGGIVIEIVANGDR